MLFQLLISLLKSRTEGEEFKSSKFIFSSFLDLFLDLEVSFPFLHIVVRIIFIDKDTEFQYMINTQCNFNNVVVSQCNDSIYYVTLNFDEKIFVVELSD